MNRQTAITLLVAYLAVLAFLVFFPFGSGMCIDGRARARAGSVIGHLGLLTPSSNTAAHEYRADPREVNGDNPALDGKD